MEPQKTFIPPPPEGRAPMPKKAEVITPEVVDIEVKTAIDVASAIAETHTPAMITIVADTHAKLDRALARTEKVANVLDKKMFLDPILGLIPIIGDKLTAIAGLYIVAEAIRAGVPKKQIAKMLAHLAADAAAGFVPGIGDFADFFYKSHAKNVEIFRRYVEEKKSQR